MNEELFTLSNVLKISDLSRQQAIVLQDKLCKIGLLDPFIGGDKQRPFGPAATSDGSFGVDSEAALQEFCRLIDLPYIHGAVTPEQVTALSAAQPDSFLPIQFEDTPNDGVQTRLARRILRYMQQQGYWIARSPRARNIVYAEGMDPDGRPNSDRSDEWNDRRMVIRIAPGGEPQMLVNDQSTTEPGKFYTLNPQKLGVIGAARIAFGQYKAWRIGKHKGFQPALVQRGPLRVHRDVNKNFMRDKNDVIDIGTGFGINQHSTERKKEPRLIDRYSAGCLVGRRYEWHLSFLQIVTQDYRFDANPQYMFMSAILPGDKV